MMGVVNPIFEDQDIQLADSSSPQTVDHSEFQQEKSPANGQDLLDVINSSPDGSSVGDSGIQVPRSDWKKNVAQIIMRSKPVSLSVGSSPAERKRSKDSPFRPRSQTLVVEPDLIHGSYYGENDLPFGNRRSTMDLGLLNSKSRKVSLIGDMHLDSVSVDFDMEAKKQNCEKRVSWSNISVIFSGIYAMLVVVMGGILYVSGERIGKYVSELFNVTMIGLGMSWLIFLHWDLHRYKASVLRSIVATDEASQVDQVFSDKMSVSTHFVLNQSPSSAYYFLRGRHSGSFYLKAGMAAFCFGHLINKGLLLGEQLLYYTDDEKMRNNCASATAIVQHAMKPLYSFYQLFIVFKYSNIVINRYKELARFGLMHCIATCLCFWFNTIVEDAMEHYKHQEHLDEVASEAGTTQGYTYSITDAFRLSPSSPDNTSSHYICKTGTIFDTENFKAIPYLYPFTIEYNILLSAVWFIVWHNIGVGKSHHKADPIHFERKASNFGLDNDVIYQSNLVISADCHSANKGLFAGLLMLLGAIVSVIVFFVAIHNYYVVLGVNMYNAQALVLTLVSLLGIIIAYSLIMKLDINVHPITFLDDVLLFIPIPFFFCHSLLGIIAEIRYQGTDSDTTTRICVHILVMLQVVIQTPCIMDGLRRCSNDKTLQYKKPGREIITFLIILNICMWIVDTFEQKTVEPFLGQTKYYGPLYSVFIGHATFPLMLFYRFHSSVCLADIWKSAYEKGE